MYLNVSACLSCVSLKLRRSSCCPVIDDSNGTQDTRVLDSADDDDDDGGIIFSASSTPGNVRGERLRCRPEGDLDPSPFDCLNQIVR